MISRVKRILRLENLYSVNHIPKPEKQYIYAAFIGDDCVYIGKGQGYRWKHCLSGGSHNKKLNHAVQNFLLTGKDPVQPKVILDGLSENLASGVESRLIKKFSPLFNSLKPPTKKEFKKKKKHGEVTEHVRTIILKERDKAGGAKAFFEKIYDRPPVKDEAITFNNRILRTNFKMSFLGLLVERLPDLQGMTMTDLFKIKKEH